MAGPGKEKLSSRRWRRFVGSKRGFYSLILFSLLFLLSLCAELLSNDKPFLVQYQGGYYFPILHSYPETTFDGDFATAT
ncbi:MAG: hypothetical protein Q8J76_10235, partial [Desulfobulbaceae bacterium]|nr:hypothetical protein [Desulfobulbaceae bacterium]